jgi:hypothetical protein
VNCAPAPWPGARVLWMLDGPDAENIARASLPGRHRYRLGWDGTTPVVARLP